MPSIAVAYNEMSLITKCPQGPASFPFNPMLTNFFYNEMDIYEMSLYNITKSYPRSLWCLYNVIDFFYNKVQILKLDCLWLKWNNTAIWGL